MTDDPTKASGGVTPILSLEAIQQLLVSQEQNLNKNLTELLNQQFKILDSRFSDLEKDVRRLEREVQAVATLPVPYGRPKRFHSATEYQSVTGGTVKRLGYTS